MVHVIFKIDVLTSRLDLSGLFWHIRPSFLWSCLLTFGFVIYHSVQESFLFHSKQMLSPFLWCYMSFRDFLKFCFNIYIYFLVFSGKRNCPFQKRHSNNCIRVWSPFGSDIQVSDKKMMSHDVEKLHHRSFACLTVHFLLWFSLFDWSCYLVFFQICNCFVCKITLNIRTILDYTECNSLKTIHGILVPNEYI